MDGQADAVATARALEAWAHARAWTGSDPYDGMNATRLVGPLRRTRRGRQALTQVVKRSPLDLRPLLGVPPGESAAAIALAASAYARNGFLEPDAARSRLDACLARLEDLRSPGFEEPCWGYHFDVQTRVFFYPRDSPNTIATVFGGLALLDAYEATGDVRHLQRASAVGDFFLRRVPQTSSGEPGAYFGYLVDDRTPIHNANLLVAMLLARLWEPAGRRDFAEAAEQAVAYTVARQRPDGSWPYGELSHLGWVDNHHTGYVLEALEACGRCGIVAADTEALMRGAAYYRDRLFRADGAPRYLDTASYPIDAQCLATAIQTLSALAASSPELAEAAWRTFSYGRRAMLRRDGAFMFQRRRLWTIRTPHVRWAQAPMLLALTHLIRLPEQT